MRKLIPLFLSILFLAGCDQQARNEGASDTTAVGDTTTYTMQSVNFASANLEKMWETDTMMLTSESVLYDEKRDRIYVSNINGKPAEKDQNGFISTLNMKGEIINAYWFSGYLSAPKGMAINGDKLYVSDINRIVEVDLESEASTNTWEIDTAKFLNDVAAGPDGTIYFSDSQTNTIYTLKDSTVSVFISDAKLNGPNGIFIDNESMMVTNMNGGELLKIRMDDKDIQTMASGIGAGDGIVPAGNGQYLASSWNGQVFLINDQGNTKNLLDTRNNKINSADIEYIESHNMLLVPTFGGNSVVAYRLQSEKENQQ